MSRNLETSESEDAQWRSASPFGRAAIDHVIDETHFAATEKPNKQGSSANASAARCTCTLVVLVNHINYN